MKTNLDVVTPVGWRLLIRKDDYAKVTKSGIHLPDKYVIPNTTGRIVGIAKSVADDVDGWGRYFELYQRVVFHSARAVPVDFEQESGRLLVVPIEDVVAIIGPANKKEALSGLEG